MFDRGLLFNEAHQLLLVRLCLFTFLQPLNTYPLDSALISTHMSLLKFFLLALLLYLSPSQRTADAREKDTVTVVITTELGNIKVGLYAKKAPITVQNFLRYVDSGFYNGGIFHRTVKLDNQPGKNVLIEVIQAGINPDSARRAESFSPIPLERTNKTGLHHRNGTT